MCVCFANIILHCTKVYCHAHTSSLNILYVSMLMCVQVPKIYKAEQSAQLYGMSDKSFICSISLQVSVCVHVCACTSACSVYLQQFDIWAWERKIKLCSAWVASVSSIYWQNVCTYTCVLSLCDVDTDMQEAS